MTSTGAFPVYDGAAGLSPRSQSPGQIYETLKTQLDSSAFDQLFQFEDFRGESVSTIQNRGVSPVELVAPLTGNSAQQADGKNVMPEAGIQTPAAGSFLNRSPALNESMISETAGQDTTPPTATQFPQVALVDNSDDSHGNEALVTPPLPGSGAEFAKQNVIVGMQGEEVRVWVRNHGLELMKEQLITKIRSELSWAGMALASITLNGERIFDRTKTLLLSSGDHA